MGVKASIHCQIEESSSSFEDFKTVLKAKEVTNKVFFKRAFSYPNLGDNGLRRKYFDKLAKKKKKDTEESIQNRCKTIKRKIELFTGYSDIQKFYNDCLIEKSKIIEDNITSISKTSAKNISTPYSKPLSKINSSSDKRNYDAIGFKAKNNSTKMKSKFNNSYLKDKLDQLKSYTNTIRKLTFDQELEVPIQSIENGKEIICEKLKSTPSINWLFTGKNKNLTYAKTNDGSHIDSYIQHEYGSEISNYDGLKQINGSNEVVANDYELYGPNSGELLRRSYMEKLLNKRIWQPNKNVKDHNSIIVFDWDDTLLCTGFITPNGIFDENLVLIEKDLEVFRKIETNVLRLLSIAIERGDTYIITNAEPGWVEFSAERFYPRIKSILKKIKIISARGLYEQEYPRDSRMWKILSFLEIKKSFDKNLVTNIICIGDSLIEIEASHILASKFNNSFIKTVKLSESPEPEELNRQVSVVADEFIKIYSALKNLTIRVEKKSKR